MPVFDDTAPFPPGAASSRDYEDSASSPPGQKAHTHQIRAQRWRRWLRRRLHLFLIAVLLLIGVVVLLADRVFVVIHAGEAGALWNRFSGTRVDRVYEEGLHIISPLDVMTPYEVRKQVVLYELDVLSIEGLKLQLKLAIRFQPAYHLVGMLHEHIGPDYLTRVILPQTESVLRKQLGNATAEQIYTNRGGMLTRAMLMAVQEAGRNFVDVEDVIIRRIQLPSEVRAAIEDKVTQRQLLASYQFRRKTAVKEAQRVRIEADGIRDYQAIVDETLSDQLLVFQGIEATRALAGSENPKTLVVGAGSEGMAFPIILGGTIEGSGPAPTRKITKVLEAQEPAAPARKVSPEAEKPHIYRGAASLLPPSSRPPANLRPPTSRPSSALSPATNPAGR
jgi:regulator of protease activity HflC (stomatin/prohibitin superfamily)